MNGAWTPLVLTALLAGCLTPGAPDAPDAQPAQLIELLDVHYTEALLPFDPEDATPLLPDGFRLRPPEEFWLGAPAQDDVHHMLAMVLDFGELVVDGVGHGPGRLALHSIYVVPPAPHALPGAGAYQAFLGHWTDNAALQAALATWQWTTRPADIQHEPGTGTQAVSDGETRFRFTTTTPPMSPPPGDAFRLGIFQFQDGKVVSRYVHDGGDHSNTFGHAEITDWTGMAIPPSADNSPAVYGHGSGYDWIFLPWPPAAADT